MKEEIRVGVEFLRQFLAKYGKLNQAQIDTFASKLTKLLETRYVNHWYEMQPMKGQAFRCLRLKGSESYMDPVLEQILAETNLKLNQLGFPSDFTLWIDPGEVSVRFGDQVGYTYTIARLNKSENDTTNENGILPQNQSESGSKLNETHANGSDDAPSMPKSALIVENSAKIFDEKLTAFIRQNSCTNNVTCSSSSLIEKKIEADEDLDDDFMSNELIDRLITLSAEKRTISPPVASTPSPTFQPTKTSIIRTNSSSIDINPSNIGNAKCQTNNNCNSGSKTKLESKKANNQLYNTSSGIRGTNPIGSSLINNNQTNRLSYNDSCYYSSSSSSCSSSLGSTHDDNYLAHLNWFKQDQQQQQPPQSSLIAKPTLFEEKEEPTNADDSFQSHFLFKPSSFYGKFYLKVN